MSARSPCIWGFVLPPGTDDAIVATLRKAIADALNDADACALLADKLKIEYDFIDGESSERIVGQLRAEFHGDPRIAQEINRLITEK